MRGQPFTELCRQLAELSCGRAADLHAHTTASDGDYTPSQLVAFAKQQRLTAIAITDHDTFAGVPAALKMGRSLNITVVPGVEVSTEFEGRELHLLAYFVPLDDPDLQAWFTEVCERRRERFDRFLNELTPAGVLFEPWRVEHIQANSASLGRRHLASLLLASGRCKTRFEAFRSFLHPLAARVPKLHLTPMHLAIDRLRSSGAVTSLAHPPEAIDEASIQKLKGLGLHAIEVNFPSSTSARSAELRQLAQRHGLAVTGGSDCHGPERVVGSFGISKDELDALQRLTERCGKV